jgi:hypothetical protein
VKKYCKKGWPLYAIQVLNSVENDKPNLEDHPILREYKDVFPDEVLGLPPRRDIECVDDCSYVRHSPAYKPESC